MMIAMALACEPDLLIADVPGAALAVGSGWCADRRLRRRSGDGAECGDPPGGGDAPYPRWNASARVRRLWGAGAAVRGTVAGDRGAAVAFFEGTGESGSIDWSIWAAPLIGWAPLFIALPTAMIMGELSPARKTFVLSRGPVSYTHLTLPTILLV